MLVLVIIIRVCIRVFIVGVGIRVFIIGVCVRVFLNLEYIILPVAYILLLLFTTTNY